jgi:hypothetical protein
MQGIIQRLIKDRVSLIIIFIFTIVFIGLTLQNLTQQNLIGDEAVYILEGDTYLHKSDSFYNNSGSPRLLKLGTGVMLYFLPLNRDYSSYYHEISTDVYKTANFVYVQNSQFARQIIVLSRIPHLLLGILLGITLYFFTKHYFGYKTATIAIILYATNPVILAHAATANIDLGTTALIFISYALFFKYLDYKDLSNLDEYKFVMLLGIILGITQATKISAILLYGLFTVIFIVLKGFKKIHFLLVLFLVSFISLWAVYQFQIGPILRPEEDSAGILALLNVIPGVEPYDPIISQSIRMSIWPLGSYFNNFTYQLTHNFYGHTYYLLGELADTGWWYFTPAILFIKNSLILVVFSVLGTGLILLGKKISLKTKLLFLLWPILFFVWSINSRLQLGVRYLLPLFPGLIILAAYGIGHLSDKSIKAKIQPKYLVIIFILGAYIISNIRIYPNYFSYLNESFTGINPIDIVYDSDYDWGQNVYQLAEVQKQEKFFPLYFRGFGAANYEFEGIKNETDPTIAFSEKKNGYYAFSHSALVNMRRENPALFSYFYPRRPIKIIGKNIYVYNVEFTQ